MDGKFEKRFAAANLALAVIALVAFWSVAGAGPAPAQVAAPPPTQDTVSETVRDFGVTIAGKDDAREPAAFPVAPKAAAPGTVPAPVRIGAAPPPAPQPRRIAAYPSPGRASSIIGIAH